MSFQALSRFRTAAVIASFGLAITARPAKILAQQYSGPKALHEAQEDQARAAKAARDAEEDQLRAANHAAHEAQEDQARAARKAAHEAHEASE